MVDRNKYTPDSRKFYKSNFVELLELLTPNMYALDDQDLSGVEVNPLSLVINSHLEAAKDINQVLSVSAVAGTQTSNLSSLEGISQYFVKQNELTKITTQSFREKILLPLSANFDDFDTSSAYKDYLSSTLLPKIIPPGQSTPGTIENNLSELSAFTENATGSSVHNYLVDSLGWFYFLNTSGLGGFNFSPSSFVLDELSKLFVGAELETVDGVKGFTEYIWRNVEACSFGQYIPSNFLSGSQDAITDPKDGPLPIYTSGVQKLDNLKTLIDVVYSPLKLDEQDFSVKEAFDNYIDANIKLKDLVSAGPHRKFLNALGFHFSDISDQVENIKYIYDIENADQENLRYIADLIGFKLRGNQSEKWRHQLRVATDIYKKAGTQEALRAALNALIVNSVLDIDNKIVPLWESYLPFLIWYALGTESPLFKNLRTWTPLTAKQTGVVTYSFSSLEENIQLATDSILLDLAVAYPKNFKYYGNDIPFPRFYYMNSDGTRGDFYTALGDPGMKPWHAHPVDGPGYSAFRRQAFDRGDGPQWELALTPGPFGEGVYMVGETHPKGTVTPQYLLFEGDPEFLFNYRGKRNFPLPPFEEVKYFRECVVTSELVELLVDRLKCFKVRPQFADQVGDFLIDSAVTTETNIGSLNEFLMFFSSVQHPPNYDDVMFRISDYEKNLLGLWNGKSSHFFIDFDNTDFNFRKSNLENDSKYALYETARVAQEYSPAHSIPRVNLNASAVDGYLTSSTRFMYLGLDDNDTRELYSSATVIGNAGVSGVLFPTTYSPAGRSTFTRDQVDLSSLNSNFDPPPGGGTAGPLLRRDLRRRNLRYLLPEFGYYDRTGFNAPVSYDPSVLENSTASSLGELTLGYVASAGKFHPTDYRYVSGVWHICEGLNSSNTFSGVDTSNTFPYRGLNELGSDAKRWDVPSATDRYVDRGQTPPIIRTMHSILENKARSFAEIQVSNNLSSYENDAYWKDQVQSFANSAVASGYVINSFSDYENFKFGREFQYLYSNYTKDFGKHLLGKLVQGTTGGNIFAHVFGKALYNCDFSVTGSNGAEFIQTSLSQDKPINASSVWGDAGLSKGTFIADQEEQAVVPLIRTYTFGDSFDFRNPTILSGIEFCDISGAPTRNEFRIIHLGTSAALPGQQQYIVDNPIIKCKSVGGLPRMRFDVSSYGEVVNKLIPQHQFKLNIRALVGDENRAVFGGGELGVWIHTEPASGLMWSWTEDNKWTPTEVSKLNITQVLSKLSHRKTFKVRTPEDIVNCLNALGVDKSKGDINDKILNTIKKQDFENFEIKFDTRNFTIHNNYEYKQIIDKNNPQFIRTDQVHENRNYVIEVFFVPNNNYNKYLLIDDIELQDETLRYWAGDGLGTGIETSSIPLRRFIKENKYEYSKQELADVLGFYNTLVGGLASRDSSDTSAVMGPGGGSRLSYRVHPEWGPYVKSASQYTVVEFDN